jgi:adenylate cyclase
MQLAMEDINRENIDRGLPPLSMGIGINTGEVIVGNIGSKDRAKYGVVGHNINLASRIEGSTVGGQVLISKSTYEQVKDLVVIRSVLPVTFKGVEEDINLYDVAGVKEPYNLMLPDLTGDALSLPQPIPVIVNKMRGKKVALSSLNGQLTHFSAQWVKVTINEEISSPSDLRIDITGIEATDHDHIYAKVVQAAHQDDGYSHLLRISYLGPTAKKIISAHP